MSTNSSDDILQLFSLKGKWAICTGVTNGVAYDMCLTMAKAGADIVAIVAPWDPPEVELSQALNNLGRQLKVFRCDIAKSAAIRACFQAVWESDIIPDILLNTSTLNKRGSILELTDEDIDLILDVNLKGAYVVAQEFGKRLISLNRKGKIINYASSTAHLAMTNVSTYAAAKAGVLQMTKAFSNEWAKDGIQVNCISPGYTKTPMTASLRVDYPEMDAYITDRTPAGRWGMPQDYRGTILFLSSSASDFITGITIVVDGGMLAR